MTREEKEGFPEYKIIRDEYDGTPVVRVVNNFTRLQRRYYYEYHPRIEEIFEELLDEFKPDLVHIQHLAGASWKIPKLAKERGIPLAVSLHDYWYVCERVQLLRPDGTLCEGPRAGRDCACYCAHGAPSFMVSAVMDRFKYALGTLGSFPARRPIISSCAVMQRIFMRRRMRRLVDLYGDRCRRLLGVLSSADLLISPSEKARAIYTALGVGKECHHVIPHGLPPAPAPSASRRRPYDGSRPLVVGYAGNVMPHKGVETILRAIRKFSPARIRLEIHGRLYPRRYAAYMERAVKRFPRGQVSLHGRYRPEDLPGLFEKFDCLIIPPLWHETFNLVLWEAWAMGLPVIASRVGALADFIREGMDGLTFTPGSAKQLRCRISSLLHRPELLSRLRDALPRRSIGIEENARRYEQLFLELVAQ
jgi:glycosyltransferase involved in cell wall biosynthesis